VDTWQDSGIGNMTAIPRQQILYSMMSNRGDMQSIGTGLFGKNSARHDFIRDVGDYRVKLQKWDSSQQLQTLCCKRRRINKWGQPSIVDISGKLRAY
jgi:hypothetical protein